MEDIVLEVRNVRKLYPLYNKPVDRFKESFSFIRHKSYHRDFLALNDISFNVSKGECFGIIGTNGSGKSTLLKIITGVLNQTHGDVKVKGKISALLELGAGFNMDYTGIENIKMNCMVYGYTKEETTALIPKICEFADIGDFVYQPVKSYSSGMFARLAFAVAINVDPDILIVDEALSVGDIFFQAKCYKKFEEFKSLGKTILFVTHDMTSVLKYCDRVLLINRGEFVKIGKPNEVVDIFKKILADSYNKEEKTEEVKEEAKEEVKVDINDLWKNHLPLNPTPNIYGNGKVDIIDIGLFNEKNEITNTFERFKPCKLSFKVRFNEEVKNPIFAFTLKNRKGQEICGTNTWYENIDFGTVDKNSIITVSYSFTLPLSSDQYLLDLGVTRFEQENLEVMCRNYEITTVDVISPRENIGFLDLGCKIDYTRE